MVSNGISTLSKKINITVLYPEPADLQVTLNTGHQAFPSCIPETFVKAARESGAEIGAVFLNTAPRFECLVVNGINLTFDWSVRKVADGDGRKQIEDVVVAKKKTFCKGACLSSYLVST